MVLCHISPTELLHQLCDCGKSFHFAGSPFPYLPKKENASTYFLRLLGKLNEFHVEGPRRCVAHSKCYMC